MTFATSAVDAPPAAKTSCPDAARSPRNRRRWDEALLATARQIEQSLSPFPCKPRMPPPKKRGID